jgi:poly(3-hydroxybutyrate) depolymerase
MASRMTKLGARGSCLLALVALPLACSIDDAPGGNAGGSTSGGSGNISGSTSAAAGADSAGSSTTGGTSSAGASNGGTTSTGGSTSAGSANGGSANAGSANGGSANGGVGTSGTSGNGGASSPTASAGCEMPAGQALNDWVPQPKLNVSGTDREWWVWLPTNYDPKKPYPLVFNFHGCSSSGNIVPMQNVTGDKAILVRATGISDNVCWDAGAGGNDVKFFDQMLADVLAKRCVDTSRVFATGYSSGSWLVNTLGCERGDKLRATGTVSGGTFGNKANCKGKYARMFIHDANDNDNKITDGNDDERDRLVTANHCTNDRVMEAPAPCARYQGCDPGYPVIWCETTGKGHARQDSLAPGAFWGLFSSL